MKLFDFFSRNLCKFVNNKAEVGFSLVIICIAFFMLLPLYLTLKDFFGIDYGVMELWQNRTVIQAIGRSLVLALCSGMGAALIAVPQACCLAYFKIPLKKLWLILFVLPLVIPSYIYAYSYLATFGEKGFYEIIVGHPLFFEFEGSLIGICLSMIMVNTPLIFLMTYTSLIHQPVSLNECAKMLGCTPVQTFFRVTLPNLKIPIASGILLVSLYTLSDFGTPAILNYNTLTYHIFKHLNRGRFEKASLFALILIAIAFVFLLSESIITKSKGRVLITEKNIAAHFIRIKPLPLYFLLTGFGIIVFISLIIPLSTIFYWFSKGRQSFSFTPNLTPALMNSLLLATLTALTATLLALPAAWCAVRKKGFFAWFAEKITFIGNMFPGIVVALAFVSFFAVPLIIRYKGIQLSVSLYHSLAVPVLGLCIRFVPVAMSSIKTSLVQLNPRVEEASLLLGNGPFNTARLVIEPLIRPGLLSGFALVFIAAIKELPVTLILAPPGKRYLTQEIWDMIDEAEYSLVAAPALLLLGISCISLYFIFNKESYLK